MEWLPNITTDTFAVLRRPVSSTEVKEYQRRTGLSRWSLRFDVSPTDMVLLAVAWVVFCVGLAVLMPLVAHWLVLVVMISILAAASIMVFFRASERAIRRHVRMADFASRCGLAYDPIGKIGAIGTGLVFDVGYSRHYRGVLSYEHAGQRLLEVSAMNIRSVTVSIGERIAGTTLDCAYLVRCRIWCWTQHSIMVYC